MMLRRRLYYFAILAGVSYLVLLYDFPGLRFLVGCLLALPLGSLVLLALQSFLCRYVLEEGADWVYQGERAALSLSLENRSFWPVGRVLFGGRLQVPGEKEVKLKRYLLGVGAKECRTLELSADTSHCGTVRLEDAGVRIYDALGLFSLPVRGAGGFGVYVLPRVDATYGRELERVAQAFTEAQEEDVYIRGYRQGDSIHRIYWKLSAKEGELQVRDHEPFSSVTLYLDFPQDLPGQAAKWDAYLTKAVSLLAYLTKLEQNVTEVVWGEGECFCRYSVQNIDETVACMRAVLGQRDGGAAYWETPVFALEQGYRLDGDGRLFLGGALFL